MPTSSQSLIIHTIDDNTPAARWHRAVHLLQLDAPTEEPTTPNDPTGQPPVAKAASTEHIPRSFAERPYAGPESNRPQYANISHQLPMTLARRLPPYLDLQQQAPLMISTLLKDKPPVEEEKSTAVPDSVIPSETFKSTDHNATQLPNINEETLAVTKTAEYQRGLPDINEDTHAVTRPVSPSVTKRLQCLGFRGLPGQKIEDLDDSYLERPGIVKKKDVPVDVMPRFPSLNLHLNPNRKKVSSKDLGIPKHAFPPEPKPTAVCFNIKGSSLSHRDVKEKIEAVVRLWPGIGVQSIQFVPRAINIGSVHADNRWVITLNTEWARNRLAGTEVVFNDTTVQLRRYDDIMQLEYKQYNKAMDFKRLGPTSVVINS